MARITVLKKLELTVYEVRLVEGLVLEQHEVKLAEQQEQEQGQETGRGEEECLFGFGAAACCGVLCGCSVVCT